VSYPQWIAVVMRLVSLRGFGGWRTWMDKKAFVCTYGWCEGWSCVNRFTKRIYSLVFLKQCVCSGLCGAMLEMECCD
jgi:hypothetical protein